MDWLCANQVKDWKLPVNKKELQSLQEEDVTLVEVRKASQAGTAIHGKRMESCTA